MRHWKILLATLLAAVLLLLLVGFTASDVPQATVVEFKEGTTIDQAWAALQGYDLVLVDGIFYWGHPINAAYWASSGSRFDPANPQGAYDEHWRRVLGMMPRIVLDTKTGAAANGNTGFWLEQVRLAEEKLAEFSRYDGCWNRHDCPTFPVRRVEVVVPGGEAMIDRIEREQTAIQDIPKPGDYNPALKVRSYFLALWVILHPQPPR